MGRAPCCDKANVKRGPWSPEEDETLKSYIHKHGTGGNWIALPGKAGLRRCGKSCRLRWLNYLRPGIKHGAFTEEEDRIIFSLFNQMGSRWSVIASQLHGRTDNDVKNYWNTKLKKKLLAAKISITSTTPTTTTSPIDSQTLLGPTTSPPSTSNVQNYYLGFSTSPAQISLASPPMLTNVGYGYGQTVNIQTLKHDPIHFPFLGLTNMSEINANAINSHSVSPSQEGSSISGSSSHALDDKCGSWASNGGGEENGVLMDFGFGFPHDIIPPGFWSSRES
ncbi:hypothetical protein L1049_018415 [Liquidambar formosana]|uniref:Uncharacterized protein n=1 Tax=Liquidambar formosana TaxID=63359 RepID=A0AAP0RAC8_LIQFO